MIKINPPIKTLTYHCERMLWYIKTGCITIDDANDHDQSVMLLQKQGVNVIRRGHDFGMIKIDGVAKIDNEWQLINFSGNEAEIQIGLKLSGLKKCYQHGDYNEEIADRYLKKYHRDSLADKSENCTEACPAFAFCQQRKIPEPTQQNNITTIGPDHHYKPEFFNEEMNYYNKKFNGVMYENFINGNESFSGLPAFTSEQIYGQFDSFDEFELYLKMDRN